MRHVATALVLSRAALDRMSEHIRAVESDEAVGMLGGTPDGRVMHVAPLPNLASAGAFLADPSRRRRRWRASRRRD